MMKKWIMPVPFVTAAVVLAGCGGGSSSGENGELTLFSSITNESEKQAFEELVSEFEEESGIAVDVNLPGAEYEGMLRVRMASNDMPDLFDTHGWSQTRYGDYTEDLAGEEWAERLDETMDGVLKDEDGKLYAFPLNQALDGISYNATLLEEYGIEPPNTFDELMEAMRTLKEESDGEVTPMFMAQSEAGAIAQYFDQMATPLLTVDGEENYEAELMNGTFDWSNYTFLPEQLKVMQDEGLINEDAVTARGGQAVELMAQNEIAFIFAGGSFGADVTALNPDVEVGAVPVPSIHGEDGQRWIGGERHTLAVWNESEAKEEALQFLDFMAEDENAARIAEATSMPSPLDGVDVNHYYEESMEPYADVEVEPYFDRVYLPSGMWDVIGNTGEELLADSMTPEQVSAQMESEYHRLREEVGVEEGESLEDAEEEELSEEEIEELEQE